MNIIDSHIHFSRIELVAHTAQTISAVDYSSSGLIQECTRCGISQAIVMGLNETSSGAFPDSQAPNPMGMDLPDPPGGLALCLGVNPERLLADPAQVAQIRARTADPKVVGIKLYPGYYFYDACHRVYADLMQMAQEQQLPVVIHSGDTFSPRAIVRYAHPLNLSELAVRYPEVTFVVAHLGNPWVMDVAVMLANYPNVYADLSGLILGDTTEIQRFSRDPRMMDYLHTALSYSGRYDKLLFGSDWPLVPIEPYIAFVKLLVPPEFHRRVFGETALEVFPRLVNAKIAHRTT